MTHEDFERRVSSIAALADPVRRALYRYVISQDEPVGREQAASAIGVAHHVAKFNLDKLEQEGLLEAEFSRPPGRRGPGAGRPTKRYRRTSRDIEVSLPERRYDLAGQVMASAIAASEKTAVPVGEALEAAASDAGRELGQQVLTRAGSRPSQARLRRAIQDVLSEHGYHPRVAGKTIKLMNCPFHSLAQSHQDLVCGMNLNLISGVLEDATQDALCAQLTPEPGMCCVTIATRKATA